MTIVSIVLLTLISAFFFDILPIRQTCRIVWSLHYNLIKIINYKKLTDNQKQIFLIKSAIKILCATSRIFVLIFIASLPVGFFVVLKQWNHHDFYIIFSIDEYCLMTLIFLLYFLFKVGILRYCIKK